MAKILITETDRVNIRRLSEALKARNMMEFRSVLHADKQSFDKIVHESSTSRIIDQFLKYAANDNCIEAMNILYEEGANPKAQDHALSSSELIDHLAARCSIEVLQWFIDKGANIHSKVKGDFVCGGLISAVMNGLVEKVKFFVDHGAVLDGLSHNGNTALDFAIIYGQHQIAEYLRSLGAKTAAELYPDRVAVVASVVEQENTFADTRAHLIHHLGDVVYDFPLHEIVTDGPQINLLYIRDFIMGQNAIATMGMSARAFPLPENPEISYRAELLMFFPGEVLWPLNAETILDDRYRWPIDWLRKLARYPYETGMGYSECTIIDNGDPPQPLAPGGDEMPASFIRWLEENNMLATRNIDRKFTSFAMLTTALDWGQWKRPDGEMVYLLTVAPLFLDERNYEREFGKEAFLDKMNDNFMCTCVFPGRSDFFQE